MLFDEVILMSDELFKSVKIGGYDKVEVLDFIQNKFKDFEENDEKNKEIINKYKNEIDELNVKLLEYDERLATILVENQRLVDVITHHEKTVVQEYTQNQLTNAILSINKLSDKMIQEAEIKSKRILDLSKAKAFQQISFKTDANKILEDYENRYKKLAKNISDLYLISNTLLESITEVNTTLSSMLESLPKDISEISKDE